MGYYHIRLDSDAQKLCTIILPWGKYKYKRLPMGLACSTDIFQSEMSSLVSDLTYARAYLDDLLCLTSGTFDDHIDKLKVLLQRLQTAGLKVNAAKSLFCTTRIEYLGYVIDQQGIKPCNNKVNAILNLEPPKNLKELRRTLGMVQFYRDMWEKRTHILSPLTDLVGECSPKSGINKKKATKKFEWLEKHQKAFDDMKKIVSREVTMAYPDFEQPFDIYTDASSRQLGAVITQNNRPIAFYSKKLSSAQQNYSVTDLELLSIVMTLKEFRNILLGQRINIHTDHKNLESDFSNMTSQRSIRWRMLIEEFGPNISYIKGTANTVADALSRLNFSGNITNKTYNKLFCHVAKIMTKTNFNNILYAKKAVLPEDSDNDFYPLDMNDVAQAQATDTNLRNRIHQKSKRKYTKKVVNLQEVVLENGKIFIPKNLRRRTLQWFHHWLCHPGETRLEQTIPQTMTWPKLRQEVRTYVRTCHRCQMSKRNKRNYGHLPPKTAHKIPWSEVHCDTVGPYSVKQICKKTGKVFTLQLAAMTMIDPVTNWFELFKFQRTLGPIILPMLSMIIG